MSAPGSGSALWATAALLAVFLPGLLLALAGMSLWSRLAGAHMAQAMLAGVNAAVAVHTPIDAAVAATGFALLQRWRVPPILVAALCVAAGAAMRS